MNEAHLAVLRIVRISFFCIDNFADLVYDEGKKSSQERYLYDKLRAQGRK